jgi:hypothetical protein
MAGLVPATHALLRGAEDVGARHKAGHDDRETVRPRPRWHSGDAQACSCGGASDKMATALLPKSLAEMGVRLAEPALSRVYPRGSGVPAGAERAVTEGTTT